jgi:hypothetical protein
MNLKILYLIAFLIFPFKLNAQSITQIQDTSIAKDLAECTAIFKILLNIGHSTKPENLSDPLLTQDEKSFLQENLKKHWNLLSVFLEHSNATRKAYASIHEFYKTSNYEDAIGIDSQPLEAKAKKDILQGNVSNEWIEKSVKCIYIYNEVKINNITKVSAVNGYNKAINKYDADMQNNNDKNEFFKAFQEISKYSLIAWKNYRQFETLHESNMKVKSIIDNNRHKLFK